MKRVEVINAKDEWDLVRQINEKSKTIDIFATQPIQKKNGEWSCFIWFNTENSSISPYKAHTSNKMTIKDPNSPVTEKQKYFLKKIGYEGDFSTLTKLEASKMIKEKKESANTNQEI